MTIDDIIDDPHKTLDTVRELRRENERLLAALEDIQFHDEGFLGGGNQWTTEQWHDYIRQVIERMAEKARAALVR